MFEAIFSQTHLVTLLSNVAGLRNFLLTIEKNNPSFRTESSVDTLATIYYRSVNM
jgi:hypothetical protein